MKVGLHTYCFVFSVRAFSVGIVVNGFQIVHIHNMNCIIID